MLPVPYLWNKAPAIRLLAALIAGIILQVRLSIPLYLSMGCFCLFLLLIVIYSFLSVTRRFRLKVLNGAMIHSLIISAACMITFLNDERNHSTWFGNQYRENSYIMATITEPPVEKDNSFKAVAAVNGIGNKSHCLTTGKIIIYFEKKSFGLQYGSRIIFSNPLQPVKNSGNPGGFDYRQLCLSQGITHHVYLRSNEFEKINENRKFFDNIIFQTRFRVVKTLQNFIKGEKEAGLAEALLIGYKEDLDKNLMKAYANTGVVHVIAISGLHLGLIYWLLLLFTHPLKKVKGTVWLRLVLILCFLWMFSLVAGGRPSVMRAAAMFSFIALGEVLERRSNIYNSLALSAFLLLSYNPFWLGDPGFQLSYGAVLSIVMFYRPIYHWFCFRNKLLDFVWKLQSVTIAAQLLTLPVSIYHFRQVPVLFILSNIVAVPLASIVLIGEIILCSVSWIAPLATFTGSVLENLIWFMNNYIERLDSVSFAVWNDLLIDRWQLIALMVFILSFTAWLVDKEKRQLFLSLACVLLFTGSLTIHEIKAQRQKKLIVYNVPKFSAIDIIDGTTCFFAGDTTLVNGAAADFHILPSRILHGVRRKSKIAWKQFRAGKAQVCILDSGFRMMRSPVKKRIDLLVLTKKAAVQIPDLAASFSIGEIVIDSSVPKRNAARWKIQCQAMNIPCHDVSESGAFILSL